VKPILKKRSTRSHPKARHHHVSFQVSRKPPSPVPNSTSSDDSFCNGKLPKVVTTRKQDAAYNAAAENVVEWDGWPDGDWEKDYSWEEVTQTKRLFFHWAMRCNGGDRKGDDLAESWQAGMCVVLDGDMLADWYKANDPPASAWALYLATTYCASVSFGLRQPHRALQNN